MMVADGSSETELTAFQGTMGARRPTGTTMDFVPSLTQPWMIWYTGVNHGLSPFSPAARQATGPANGCGRWKAAKLSGGRAAGQGCWFPRPVVREQGPTVHNCRREPATPHQLERRPGPRRLSLLSLDGFSGGLLETRRWLLKDHQRRLIHLLPFALAQSNEGAGLDVLPRFPGDAPVVDIRAVAAVLVV